MNINRIESNKDKWPISILCKDHVINPKGVIQIIHDIGKYKEYYLEMAEYFNKQGYIVVIHDQRGHGQSVIDVNDLGYFGKLGASYLIDDIYQVNQWIKGQYSHLPVILLGHGIGCIEIMNYLKLYDHTISGVIMYQSPSKNRLANIDKTIVYLLTKIKGKYYRSQRMFSLFYRPYKKNITTKHKWTYQNDSTIDKHVPTLIGVYHLFSLMDNAYDKNSWHGIFQVPIHFVSSIGCPYQKNVTSFFLQQKFLYQIGYHQITQWLDSCDNQQQMGQSSYENVMQWMDTIIDA